MLLIHADDDRNVRFAETVDLARRLALAGAPYEELVIPDDTHHFMRHANWVRVNKATAEFFDRKFRVGRGNGPLKEAPVDGDAHFFRAGLPRILDSSGSFSAMKRTGAAPVRSMSSRNTAIAFEMTAKPSAKSPASCNGVPAGGSAETFAIIARPRPGDTGKSFRIDAEGHLTEIK